MSETSIFKACRLLASQFGCVLLRNNNGGLQDKDGRWVFYGLGNEGKDKGIGSSDSIGWRSVTITPEMVGKPFAQFVACEIKVPGGRTDPKRLAKQTAFIEAVNRAGGKAGFATSAEEFKLILMS